ncbi:MAG: hypothetical protein AB2L22_03330 [Syntrophales bacterium]
MDAFRQVDAGKKPFQRAYVAFMLWFVGRAIQAAARVDEGIAAEFEALPPGFMFSLVVLPSGPSMAVGRDADGRVCYLGKGPGARKPDLEMKIKSIEAAMLMFTFRESTAAATARNRMIVDGDIPAACAVVRILDAVEVYLLVKPLARLAVKRYPAWPLSRFLIGRPLIYLRAVLGI